ncbi:MAG: DUF4847 domain-containing protein [Prevotellaceae bacterium]|jgi:hypothetical protein|nr:DUF4847 domain-containing protein [Prevotellaceae bacterium]
MKKKLEHLKDCAMQGVICFVLLLAINGCSQTDDVISIFTGKKWKLTYIATEGSHKMFNFWGEDKDGTLFAASMALLKADNNFVLTFEGANLNGNVTGTVGGRGVLATLGADSRWSVSEGSRNITLSVKQAGNEQDVLAKAFMIGVQNSFRYEGDNDNLYLYYHSGQNVMFMAFKPQKSNP